MVKNIAVIAAFQSKRINRLENVASQLFVVVFPWMFI